MPTLVVDNTLAPGKRSAPPRAARQFRLSKTKRPKAPPRTLSEHEYRKRRLQLLHEGHRYLSVPSSIDCWGLPGAYRLATPGETVELGIAECQAEIALSERQISNSLDIIEHHKGKLTQLRAGLAELEAKREQLAEGVVDMTPAQERRDLRSFSRVGRRSRST